jgi:Fic family protein
MNLNYLYKKTSSIKKLLNQIRIQKQVIDLLPRFPQIELNLKRQSLLKSSLYSARIEGNQLQLHQLSSKKRNSQQKIEVFNILSALNWLYSPRCPKQASTNLILKLHQFVLKDIAPAGKLRTKPSAIFNQTGVVIYLPPPPPEIADLTKTLIKKINTSKDSGPIKAAISHYIFEKIHPFMDGNGRVGRLLSTYILKQSGYGFRGLVSPEEYLEKHRPTYYQLLAQPGKDITDFVEFFLLALTTQADKTLAKIKNINQATPEDKLLPRRQEILAIIRDHQLVSFDFIKRRFAKLSPRTLHYDFQQLIKKGFVKKLGSTRGALYSPV